MIPGTSTAAPDEDPFADDHPEPAWETGTALDEFLPIYRSLSRWTDHHGPMAPDQVDAMDLSVVAVLLGVDGGGSFDAVAAQWRDEYAREVEQFQTEQETARAKS